MKNILLIPCVVIIFQVACTKKNTALSIPIPNGGFESWSAMLPQYWKTNSCPFCVPPYETYIVRQDSNAHQGTFAAKFIYNNVYAATAENKFAVSTHPNNLSAYVKCNLYGTDTVFIKIQLFKNAAIVDSGKWFGTTSLGNYSKIIIPVSQNSSQADTALISIQGGHKNGYPSNNTELWVDDLRLY